MAKVSKEEYKELKALDDKWKWIARDENTHFVNIYEEKPYKDTPVWMWRRNSYVGRIESDMSLFQFIQWEDREPYSIDELIEEYESEEKEVNKDIEWLKGRFRGRKIFKPQNDREVGYNAAIDEFSKYVDQLDEPEITLNEAFNKDDEPETVASVMTDYFGAAARLKEVLAMEVEEMENDDN